jgi:hypothetical protein
LGIKAYLLITLELNLGESMQSASLVTASNSLPESLTNSPIHATMLDKQTQTDSGDFSLAAGNLNERLLECYRKFFELVPKREQAREDFESITAQKKSLMDFLNSLNRTDQTKVAKAKTIEKLLEKDAQQRAAILWVETLCRNGYLTDFMLLVSSKKYSDLDKEYSSLQDQLKQLEELKKRSAPHETV